MRYALAAVLVVLGMLAAIDINAHRNPEPPRAWPGQGWDGGGPFRLHPDW